MKTNQTGFNNTKMNQNRFSILINDYSDLFRSITISIHTLICNYHTRTTKIQKLTIFVIFLFSKIFHISELLQNYGKFSNCI